MNSSTLDLHPAIRHLCMEFLTQCRKQGLDIRLTFTYRTPAKQDALYAQGRTKPGRIVTTLKGSASKHCFTVAGQPAAKAFDIAIYDANGNYIADGAHPLYKKAGEIGEGLGLKWGGRWKVPFDPSHFEIT